MEQTIPYVINIQRYSIHDGDGIRTTVFFKGCHLSCWWCHNPESQRYTPELLMNQDRCGGCGACEAACPQNAIQLKNGKSETDRLRCTHCESCLDRCLNNAREIAGKQYTVDELLKEIEKDQVFYEQSGGGVTLSGGEVMSQNMDYIEALLKKLKRRGYHIAIDTCGYAPYENFERVLPYADLFLYDIKLMDAQKHKKYIGQDNKLILDNLKRISEQGAGIYIRLPTIGGVNADTESMEEIIQFLKKNVAVRQVNLLPYHNTGSGKYEKLGLDYPGKEFTCPSQEEMEQFRQQFRASGFQNVKIGGA